MSQMPPILTCSATSETSFVTNTLTVRVPKILESTLSGMFKLSGLTQAEALSPLQQQRLEQITLDYTRMRSSYSGSVVKMLCADYPENQEWNKLLQPFLGQRLAKISSFWIENYFYRRLLDALDYWSNDLPAWVPDASVIPEYIVSQQKEYLPIHLRDPFLSAKMESLSAASAHFDKLLNNFFVKLDQHMKHNQSEISESPVFLEQLVLWQLWGNRADLSLSAGKVEKEVNGQQKTQATVACLANDSVHAWQQASQGPAKVTIVLDNCGLELLCDLLMTAALLWTNDTSHSTTDEKHNRSELIVELQCKTHPVFVSDAMSKDILFTLDWLARPGASVYSVQLSQLLHTRLQQGRLTIRPHAFYTSPLSFAQAPNRLLLALSESRLVLIKGDANYRRLLDERTWVPDTSFQSAMDSWANRCPNSTKPELATIRLLALRTLKWPLMVGIGSEQAQQAEQTAGPTWAVNGRCGVAQFAEIKVPIQAVAAVDAREQTSDYTRAKL